MIIDITDLLKAPNRYFEGELRYALTEYVADNKYKVLGIKNSDDLVHYINFNIAFHNICDFVEAFIGSNVTTASNKLKKAVAVEFSYEYLMNIFVSDEVSANSHNNGTSKPLQVFLSCEDVLPDTNILFDTPTNKQEHVIPDLYFKMLMDIVEEFSIHMSNSSKQDLYREVWFWCNVADINTKGYHIDHSRVLNTLVSKEFDSPDMLKYILKNIIRYHDYFDDETDIINKAMVKHYISDKTKRSNVFYRNRPRFMSNPLTISLLTSKANQKRFYTNLKAFWR